MRPIAAQTPAGWKVHIDRSQNAQDPDDKSGVTFMAMGKGFHVSGGPAGTYWHPSNTATGNFTAKGTFTLVKPSNHTNYYGLVFGGQRARRPDADLHLLPGRAGRHVPDQAAQRRADHRRAARHQERRHQDAGQHRQIRQRPRSARGRRHDLVRRQRHGRAHHAEERATAKTDGIVGFRVNHVTEVMVDDFEVQKRG